MRRFQARRANGRFRQNRIEDLGMHFNVHERKVNGDRCGALNPSKVGEPRPETCSHCGEPLTIQEEAVGASEATPNLETH